MRVNLRFRLNLVIVVSMLLIVGMGTIFTIYNARQSVRNEVNSSLDLALQSVKAGLADPLSSANPVTYWRSRMGTSEKFRHLRIRIVLNGNEPLPLANEAPQKPVQTAPVWFVWSIKPESRTINEVIGSDPKNLRIIIQDDPNDEIREAWEEARGMFGLIFMQALLVAMLAHLTLGRVLRSVPRILKGLENLENGNFHERLPDFDVPEFARIAGAFNHAAAALEKARQENRSLARRTLSVQEEERRVLAQELHDELAQSLTGLKVTASSISRDNPKNKTAVDSIFSICDELFSVVRSMIRRLRPSMLDELGLSASLDDMIENWRQQNPDIQAYLDYADIVETCKNEVKIHVFRIIQESLNNIARHAHASEVRINLEVTGTSSATNISDVADQPELGVRATVIDNGCGFDSESVRPGFGLLGIRERAESLGGKLWLQTQPEQGVALIVDIPNAVRH